jgi:SOS response regulatory protein OraA/RecX
MKELNYTKQRVIQRLTERGFNYKQIEDLVTGTLQEQKGLTFLK